MQPQKIVWSRRLQFCKHFFSSIGILVLASVGVFYSQVGQAESIRDRSPNKKQYLAQSSDVLPILKGLPQPSGITGNISELFSANAYGQQSLNFQATLKPDDAVAFYQEKLAEKGYEEREMNRATGAWGFNLVFDKPDSILPNEDEDSSKKVVLVLQGTMLGPDTININIRFEEI